MFLGEYTHSLDSKSRLTIPAKYRDFVADGLVITRHPQGNCLMAVPMAQWKEEVAGQVDKLPKADPTSARFKRMIFASAEDMTPDKQGRILIPQRLREVAGIENDVVIAGINTYFELWAPTEWRKNMEPLTDPVVVGEMFAALDI